MKSFIRVKDRYYILAQSSLAEDKTSVLKSGDMFAAFRHNGDIGVYGPDKHGIYFEGTRYLSKLVFTVEGRHPLLLSSVVKDDNELLTIDLTSPDIPRTTGEGIHKGDVHFLRAISLKNHVFHEELKITNYGLKEVELAFAYEYEADFRDIFEVRGMKRKKRGKLFRPKLTGPKTLQFSYKGLDAILRRAVVRFPAKGVLHANHARFHLKLKPRHSQSLSMEISCQTEPRSSDSLPYVCTPQRTDIKTLGTQECTILTTNYQFNKWIKRSRADVLMMLTPTGRGLYPYAGVPWYNTVFGRDGLITAFETLWLYPAIARGVLSVLSGLQARELSPQSDAEPGKIMHELRVGEMANLGEVPFGLYYGSVDATPLFLVLAGHYYDRQQDLALIKRLWPSLMAALHWINAYGDSDGDGFVEYHAKSDGGLRQQGWKDSQDSVFYANGELAEAPIALCEVQGYVYEAKQQMAKLAAVLGHQSLASELLSQAAALKTRFQEAFWCPDLQIYALALDAKKRPCRVMTSNAGHTLFSGLAGEAQARVLSSGLLSSSFYSGWGIRTVADREARYNPMSYHNGSIWPHDNAMIAYGLGRYGFKRDVLQILKGFFEATFFMDINRLPELFCGFQRRKGEGPTLYPTACSPQTWASAAIFLFIQACLGIEIDSKSRVVYFNRPVLPDYIDELRIFNLKVDSAMLDIGITYHKEGVGVRVIRRSGQVEVMTRK